MAAAKFRVVVVAASLVLAGGGLGAPASSAVEGSSGPGIVVWNHLGSPRQVANSVMGADFQATEGVVYVRGVVDGGIATTGGEVGGGGYLTMAPSDFIGPDPTQGTVEVWLQKRIQRFLPFETPLVGIFGWQPYDSGPWFGSGSYLGIKAFWSDGFTGEGGMQFDILDGALTTHHANDLGWDQVPVGRWTHVAFVWDLSGIDGTGDRMRIYRDGQLVAANDDEFTGVHEMDAPVKVLGHHAYSRFGEPTVYMDEIRVWSYARTSFPWAVGRS